MTAPYAPIADPTNVLGRRICAWTIDLLMFLALVAIVLFATGGITWRTQQFPSTQEAIDYCDSLGTDNPNRGCVPIDDEALVVNVRGSADGVWVVNSLAYVLLQGIAGGSVGKLLLGLRVVDVNGNKAGVGKSFLRTLLWIVDAITCGLPIVGGVLIFSTRGHRRVGDRAAGTFVVRKEHVGIPLGSLIADPVVAPYGYGPPGYGPPPGFGPPPGYGPPPAYPPPRADDAIAPAAPPWTDPTPYGPAAGEPEPVAAPTSDGPHWDEARDTYIQFDRARDAWLEWDDRREQWRPIDE